MSALALARPALARAARGAAAAFALMLPPRCPGCGDIVQADDSFCHRCWGELQFLGAPWCRVCGEPFHELPGPSARCRRCVSEPPAYDAARAALAYADPVRRIVLQLKHGDGTHLARVMAAQMARVGADWLGEQVDALIVPVPLHRWRLWERGYNQAALIGRALARRTGTPMSVDALVRTRSTAASGGMGRAERYENVAGAFRVARPVVGRAVVLVDDVLTTGATAHACATALKAAGATRVNLLTFARVVWVGVRPHDDAPQENP